MTVGVDDELRIREYPGDNSATPRAYGFKILDPDDLRVTRTNADGSETVLVRGTHYSVSGAGNPTGGNVTPLAPIVTGTSWRIEGDMSLGQPTDYTAGDDFPAESHERGLDRSMIAHQEARRDLEDMRGRSFMVPRGEEGAVLPPAAERAGTFDAWDADGKRVQASGTGSDAAFRTDMAADGGAALAGHKATGTGAIKRSVATLLNRLHVWVDDYATRQQAVDAAILRNAELHLQPGKEYAWDEAVTVTGKLRIVANGARIVTSLAITALTFVAGADGSEVSGGEWVYDGPKSEGYQAGANAILFTGTRNGAAVTPTWLTNVGVSGARFDGWGNGAVEYRFTRNSSDTDVIAINGGFFGIFCYSVDLHRSSGLFVNGLSGQVDGANAAASELNAYGFTATALTGDAPGDIIDRVRDPRSRDVIVKNATIMAVPTWHAIDSHGTDNLQIVGATIIDCRRGVVFTALTDSGTTNSGAKGVTASNGYGAGDVNANGMSKKGEAFWDIGANENYRNSNNRFDECYAFGHGAPGGDEGAVTIGNANDGFYAIADEQSNRIGWLFTSNISRATIAARTTNVHHAAVNPSVARISGDDIELIIARWHSGVRDPAIDTNVMVNGIVVVATNTGGAIHFEDFSLRDCTAGELLSTAGNAISADLTGNYSIMADLTLTGVNAVVTGSVRLVRQGRICYAEIPVAGITGASNAVSCTLTGVPPSFRPAATVGAGHIAALDNSNYLLAHSTIDNAGVITLTRDADNNTSAWTNGGTKGVRAGLLQWAA